jgi:hypothetical protein
MSLHCHRAVVELQINFEGRPVFSSIADEPATMDEFRPLPDQIIHKLLFIYSSSEALPRCTFPFARF